MAENKRNHFIETQIPIRHPLILNSGIGNKSFLEDLLKEQPGAMAKIVACKTVLGYRLICFQVISRGDNDEVKAFTFKDFIQLKSSWSFGMCNLLASLYFLPIEQVKLAAALVQTKYSALPKINSFLSETNGHLIFADQFVSISKFIFGINDLEANQLRKKFNKKNQSSWKIYNIQKVRIFESAINEHIIDEFICSRNSVGGDTLYQFLKSNDSL